MSSFPISDMKTLPAIPASRIAAPEMMGASFQLVHLSRGSKKWRPISMVTYIVVGNLMTRLEHRMERVVDAEEKTSEITEKRQRPSKWVTTSFDEPEAAFDAMTADMKEVAENSVDNLHVMSTAPFLLPYNATDVRNIKAEKVPHWSLHLVVETFAALKKTLMDSLEDATQTMDFKPESSDVAGLTDELFRRLLEKRDAS